MSDKYKINCYDPKAVGICKYFGLNSLPAVILVKEGSFYVLANSKERTPETFRSFLHDYSEAYLQDTLPRGEKGFFTYIRKFTRFF